MNVPSSHTVQSSNVAMDHEELHTKIEKLIDGDELRAALVLVEGHRNQGCSSEACTLMMLEILWLLNEFERARRVILCQKELGSVGRVHEWSTTLYLMEAHAECLTFIKRLPAPMRKDEAISDLAWYAAYALGKGKKEFPWLEGSRPESLGIGQMLQAGRKSEAMAYANTLHAEANPGFEAALDLTHEAGRLQDFEAVSSCLAEAESYGIRKHRTLPFKAWLLARKKSLPEAEQCIDQLLEIVPMSYSGLKMRGWIHLTTRRKESGVEALQQAITANPLGADAVRTLGRACVKHGKLRNAASLAMRSANALSAYRLDGDAIVAAVNKNNG